MRSTITAIPNPDVDLRDAPTSLFKGVLRGIVLVVGVSLGASLLLLARAFGWPTQRILRGLHGVLLWCFNLQVDWQDAQGRTLTHSRSGMLSGRADAGTDALSGAQAPVLYVANHVSYLDVFVLGSRLDASFTAKAEVAGWPVLGKLATLQDTLFLRRDPRRAREQVGVLREALRQRSHVLFAEGTSTPGTMVESFRSSLLAAAEEVAIVPLTLAYTQYDGEPMTDAERDRYAWYIPMPFGSHFLHGLGRRRATVVVTVHDPVTLAAFESRDATQERPDDQSQGRSLGRASGCQDGHQQKGHRDARKRCAAHCEQRVRAALLDSLGLDHEIVPHHYLEATGRG